MQTYQCRFTEEIVVNADELLALSGRLLIWLSAPTISPHLP